MRKAAPPPPPPPPQPPPSDQITAAVSILRHQRSKSRWSHLRSLFPEGLSPTLFSQIALHLKPTPHLALRFFQWSLRHSLCSHSLLSYSTLIHILSRSRLIPHALSLLKIALRNDPFSSSPPTIFKTLVKTYSLCGSAPFVFDLLIKACLESKKIDGSLQIVRLLRSRGISPRIGTCNSLIWWVSRCRGVCEGYAVYREVFGLDCEGGNNRVYPNVHTFNTLMGCFYQEGMVEKVEEVWAEMASLNCVPNGYSYCILMAAFCEDERMGEAEELWEEMRRKGVEHDVVAYNTMIGGFCRIGEVMRAEEFFREMGLSGVESTCVTYEHLINGYCRIRDVDSAVLLYKDMRRKGFRAEALTVEAVIEGLCGKSRVGEALEFLRVAMGNVGFSPRGKSYEVLIKGLCREGRMEEALKLQAEMVGKGFEPNLEIYNAFIEGYMKEGKEEVAEMLRKEMFQTRMQGKEE